MLLGLFCLRQRRGDEALSNCPAPADTSEQSAIPPDKKESCENTASKGRWALNGNGCAEAESFEIPHIDKKWKRNKEKQNKNAPKHKVGKTVHRFSDSSEQDSQEFLTVLFERIHNSLKTKCDLPAISSPDPNPAVSSPDKESNTAVSSPDKEMIRIQAEESWSHHLEQGHSLVVELFQGQLVSTLECDACKHVLVKFDTFMFLPITVPSHNSAVSLDECLRLYTNEDIIDGWPCSACCGEVKFGPIQQTPKGEEALYNLFAVINHYSSDHNSRGHYTTVSRCGEQWVCFDDDKVHPCSESDIVVSAVGRPQQPMSFFTKEMNVELKVKKLKDKITELSERQVSSLYIGSVNIVSTVL
eukprot:Em0005g182a